MLCNAKNKEKSTKIRLIAGNSCFSLLVRVKGVELFL
uniref:Uncharacterized protein n=1 Tax=Myoviridae sp. ctuev19 TaxID=2827716 RepID=A0A8S5SFN7_9CAUD|nr:MAG TPA: hypothetical protein [Myoviridae sp. ctuev19]